MIIPLQLKEDLSEINGFSVKVSYNPFSVESKSDFFELITRLTSQVIEVVKVSGFYGEALIQAEKINFEENEFSIKYGDDKYGFEVYINSREGTFILSRAHSSLDYFYDWYFDLMPSFSGIFTSFLQLAKSILIRHMTDDQSENNFFNLEILRVSYKFEFIMSKFLFNQDKSSNLEIMKRLISNIPGESGKLVGSSAVADDAVVRMDFKLMKKIKEEIVKNGTITTVDRLGVYIIEAPGNLEGDILHLDFVYQSDTFTDSKTKKRTPSDAESLLFAYKSVFEDFFVKIVIEGFLIDLFGNFRFKTISGSYGRG
jgi:hypothetical protein